MKIFFSVGSHSTAQQADFTTALERFLVQEGLVPQTPGRNYATNRQPLKAIEQCMRSCSGAVVLAFERFHLVEAIERRGGRGARTIHGQNMPTVWNQIEGAMAYTKGLPLLVLAEQGLREDALLENKYDWNVQWIDLDPALLASSNFRGVFNDWKSQLSPSPEPAVPVEAVPAPAVGTVVTNPANRTVRDLLGDLPPAQLWTVFTVLFGLASGIGGLAYKLGRESTRSLPVAAAADSVTVVAPTWMNDSIPLLTLRDQVSVSVRAVSDSAGRATVFLRTPGGEQVFPNVKQGEQRSFFHEGKQYLLHLLDVSGGDGSAGAVRIKVVRGG